ncbi:MAG: pilus assembly protein [Luteimonas sp.]
MHKQNLKPQTLRDRWIERFRAVSFACLATLMSLPANAGITIPNDPLTTGSRVAPNITFILDNSGSMASEQMPDTLQSTSSFNVARRAYTRNSISYNPAITYQPWVNATGSLLTGGTTYDEVYGDFNNVGNATIDLGDSSSCRYYNQNDSVNDSNRDTQVCGGVQTFYVPKDTTNASATYLGNGTNYYRYQIFEDGVIVQSDYGPRAGASPIYNRGLDNRNCSVGGSNNWRNCVAATPQTPGRTPAAERINYATWFSYHRTRMKAAKAGSSLAFSDLGNDVRVGFRTIWGNRGGFTNLDIPVANNDGLFSDEKGFTTRTNWFSKLQNSIGYNTTPLRSALKSVGDYYSNGDSTGPYGPQTGSDQLSCRQNFAILTTDGYWNGDGGFNSGGNQDGTSSAAITGPGGKSYTYTASAPYRDTVANTLADVAMYYWKTDLRSSLANTVPASTANPAFWQHMVTFGISIGMSGNTGMSSVASVPASYAAWPDPTDTEDADRIDDLLHAAVNGHGTFLAASDPEAFAAGLKAALATITERTGSFSNVSANSTRIDTETKVFQATYVSGVWTGEFSAYTENTTTNRFDVLAWKASEHIPTTGRKILTHTGAAPATFPTAGQMTALGRNGTTDQYKVTGANNAAYIAGNRTLELRSGGTLRNRNSVLGDIVSSSPAYTSDTDTLYVGANDGMLHAIDADDGAELFAYMPAGINLADLSTISRPDYSHRYFVDGPMVVSTRAQTPANKNILVGALGKGGKGVFALDVTNPGSFSAANVKWDKTSNDSTTGKIFPATGYVQDADMGLVQGAPIVAKLNNNVTVAIVSNGINSTNNHAVLFIYNLDTGALVSKIDTGVGTSAVPNGLSAPVAWDDDGDGRVDHVYAGDLYGNLWKFDLSSSTPSTWQAPTSRKKLFTAQYPGSPATLQPITSGPTVALDPKTYKTWVFFGTGSFMTTGDVSNQNVQSLYGVIDNDSTTLRTELTSRRTVLAGTRDGMPVRSFEANTPLPAGSKGWFINLLTPPSDTVEGERIVSDPQMYGSALVVASIIPVADACQSDGKGYVNAMDAFTGTSLGTSFFDLPGDDTLTDRSGNKLPIGSVDLGVGMGTMPNLMRGRLTQGGSTGGKKDVKITDPRNTGRVSWREVIRD